MKKRILATVIATCLWASAATSATFRSVDTVNLSNIFPQILLFEEFDPALGTLERVELQFFGALTLSFATQPNIQNTGTGSIGSVPYSSTAVLNFGFEPSVGGRGFESIVENVTPVNVNADGSGSVAEVIVPISFNVSVRNNGRPEFGLDDFETLIRPTNEINVQALTFFNTVSDFLPANSLVTGLPIFTLFEASATALDPRLEFLRVEGTGRFTQTYHYERFIDNPDPGPEVVPLPAAFPLLLGSLLLLKIGQGVFRRV